MKSTKKKTGEKDEVFKINASFDQLVSKSVAGNPKTKVKKAAKKKT